MRSRIAVLVTAVAAVSIGGAARAADLLWDADGPGGLAGADGSGTWDLVSSTWYDTTSATNVAWTNGNSALFGSLTTGGINGVTAYNIDVAAPIAVQNLTIGTAANGATYSFSDFGGGHLTLNGDLKKVSSSGNPLFLLQGGLTLGAGNHTFTVRDTGGDALPEVRFNAAIDGAGGITLDNTALYDSYGSVSLNADNTYAGATVITKGRLGIATSAGLGATAAGTTIGSLGTLAIGAANTPVTGPLNIAEPITITRNGYTGGDFGNYGAAIRAENGAGTITFSGPFVVDSTDARVLANTSTVIISGNITAGPSTATPGLSLTGDFAGYVTLGGDNSALTGGITLLGGVELNVGSQANLGGASSPLNFLGSASLHPVGGFMTGFGSHVINNATFSGGFDVDVGQSFTIDQALGRTLGDDANRVGSLGKRGPGTLNIASAVNLRGGQTFFDAGVVNVSSSVELHSLHLRSPILNIGNGGSVTTVVGYSSIGQDSAGTNGNPDAAVINITGNGKLIAANQDFNVSDNPGTSGTINVSDTATLTVAGGFFLSKNNDTHATLNQSGGTVTAQQANGNSLNIGQGTGSNGLYNKTGGALVVGGEMWVGNAGGGNGTFTQSAGTTTVDSWFVTGRGGATGLTDVSGGTVTRGGTRGGNHNYVGENGGQDSVMNVHGTGSVAINTGEFWLGNGGSSKGTLNVYEAGAFSVNNYLAVGRNGTSTGVLNVSGGTLTKAGGGVFVIGSGDGATGTLTQTGGAIVSNATAIGESGTGTATLSAGTANFGALAVNDSGGRSGTLNISGAAAVTAGAVVMGRVGTGTSTVNLNGGSLTATSIAPGTSTGSKTFNFTAGTLSVGNYSVAAPLVNTGTGHLSPAGAGAVGQTAITNGYTQGATATLAIELASTGQDNVLSGGPATLAGTLDLALIGGYLPASYTPVTIVSAPSVTGIFSSITNVRYAGNRALAVAYTATTVTVQSALPGDTNLNGTVGFDDLLAVAQHYQTGGNTYATGDFDGDGQVSFNDLLALAQFYGQSALTSGTALADAGVSNVFQSDWALAQSLVPEPTALAMLGLGALTIKRSRRR